MKLIILAGGVGSRLWPVSRKHAPKQAKPIVGEETLLEKTFSRLRQGFPLEDIYLSTNRHQLDLIKKQLKDLPASNYIVEPAKRDTAAAIGLATVKIYKKNPKEIIININSDHYIKDEAEYLKVIKLAEKVVRANPESGVLIGANPTYPETGYGYIKMGEETGERGGIKIFKIDQFKEKPDLAQAKKYLKKWEYLWNIGCFTWRVDTLLNLYKEHLPRTHEILMAIMAGLGTAKEEAIIEKEFGKIEPISLDYGIIEKAPRLFVIPADFGWADVGHWRTVKDILSSSEGENITKGRVIDIDSRGNLVYSYSNKLVALAGVENMIIIETEDAILICPKDRAQEVKKIVEKLKEEGLEEYL